MTTGLCCVCEHSHLRESWGGTCTWGIGLPPQEGTFKLRTEAPAPGEDKLALPEEGTRKSAEARGSAVGGAAVCSGEVRTET